MRRRLVVLAVLVPIALIAEAVIAGATADASGCFFGPYLEASSPPQGCPVTVIRKKELFAGADPHVAVLRDAHYIDLAVTILERTDLTLDVGYYETDCEGHVLSTRFEPEAFEKLTIAFDGAELHDELWVESQYGGRIVAPGDCPDPVASTPTPSCSGNYEGCPGDPGNLGDDTVETGCMSAGGGSTDIALALLVGAFLVTARRRRASNRAVLLVAGAIAAVAPARAEAAGCYKGDLLSSPAPRLGCPIVVSRSAYDASSDPVVRAIRGTDNLDVTGTVAKERRDVATRYYKLDCDGTPVDYTDTLEPYEIVTIEISDKAQAGDTIYTDGLGPATLAPADPSMPCEALTEPAPFCTIMADLCDYSYDDSDDAESVGCTSARGGTAGMLLVVLGALVVVRRRR